MVYIVGLPPRLADQNLLGSEPYCGQYGPIAKIAIKETSGFKSECFSAYVTFESEESASLAVMALKGFQLEGFRISASYGTTKYCSSFLKYGKCRKNDCLFYHKIEPHKEIHQVNNQKVFSHQQDLARNYVLQNLLSIDFCPSLDHSVFPSKASIRQTLVDQGVLEPADQRLSLQISETSTEHSYGCFQGDQPESDHILVTKIKKATYRKKSFFKFVSDQMSPEYTSVNKHLEDLIQELIL